MSLAQLDNLVRAKSLDAEPGTQEEIDRLLHSGQARLKDAGNAKLSSESRFDLAYNAAHSMSLAALRWHGYRAKNRYVVFQSLEHTIKLPPEQWRVLGEAHRKRNLAEYEGELDIDDALLKALIRVAGEVEKRVVALAPLKADGK
jgi:hypothetical protein